MTRVGWIADPANEDGTIGGAELTQQEFRAAAPHGVEIVDIPNREPALWLNNCDVAVAFNCVTYPEHTVRGLVGRQRVVRYWNDVAPHGSPELTRWFCANAANVFCSPLHQERFPWLNGNHRVERALIPPPIDLAPFRAASEASSGREGACAVAAWMNPGKAPHLAAEWGSRHGGVTFYGVGPYAPAGTQPVPYGLMPELLARFRTFVFLPTAMEPFGRLVVEAHAAGCELVVNGLVGARHWLENEPERLDTAAQDFWQLVLKEDT